MTQRKTRYSHFSVLICALISALLLTSGLALAQSVETEPVYFDAASSQGELTGARVELPASESMSLLSNEIMVDGNSYVVRDNGPSSNRVDIVFLGDGYSQGDLTSYSTSVNDLITGMLLQQPFYEYTKYFNMHRVDVISNESGIDNDPSNGVSKDTALDSQFWCQGTASTLCTNVSKAWNFAGLSRASDQVIVVVNSATSGAAAYPFSDLAVVSARQTYSVDSLLHQVGHSFGDLADEYDTGSWPTYTGFEPAEPNVSAQTAASMAAQGIKWHQWLGVDMGSQYGGLIGTYEGAMGHLYSIYRASNSSKMRALTAPFNSPSVEAFIKQIYREVSPIDSYAPTGGSLTGTDTLSIVPLQPRDRSLTIQWYSDGNPVDGATSTSFRGNDYALGNGTHTITVSVTDNTPLVRDETFRSQYMTASQSWTVTVNQNPPTIVSQPSDRVVYVRQSASFSVIAQGDTLQYQWYKNNVAINGAQSATYTAAAVNHNDSGTIYHVVVSNPSGSVTSRQALLTVPNRAPAIGSITAQQMARKQTKTLTIPVSDADGDELVTSAIIEPVGQAPGAQLSLTGNVLTITTNATFLGSFNITVTTTDGIDFTSRSFAVNVANQIPSLAPIAAQRMSWKTDSITVSLQATDLDNEAITFSAELNPLGSAPVALTLSGNQLTINPNADYLGTFGVKISATDGTATVFSTFTVTVYNNGPSMYPIANQSMHWKTDAITVPVSAMDPDGDALTYSAGLASGENAPVAISTSGPSIIINPANNYVGGFNVKLDVSDSITTISQTFHVDVYDNAPVLQAIPGQSMYYKNDYITVPLVASDADGDPLTYTAALSSGGAPVTLTVSGSSLKINPQENYIGVFDVTASVSDGKLTASRTFSVNIYNSAPAIQPIADQSMHWKVDSISVPVVASDPDGEQLTMSASLAPGSNVPVAVSTSGSNVVVNPADNYLGTFQVKVRVEDSSTFSERYFGVTVYNRAPVISPIADQQMHWILDDTRVVSIDAHDPDGESLTYSAELIGSVDPEPVLSMNGNQLTINPSDGFLGSFVIRVSVTDGALSDSRSFTVTSRNTAPDLQPICDRSIAWSQLPYDITLVGNDPDGETLTYSAFVEESSVAYDLDQVYNFTHSSDSWNYNLLGRQEKYLQGDKNEASELWFMILPSGELYEFHGSLAASKLIASLPTAYFEDPELLIDVPQPTGATPPVTATVTENVLTLDAPVDYRGTVMIRARASDGLVFDEESFLVTIYDGTLHVNTLPAVRMHWREDSKTITLSATDHDGDPNGGEISYTVSFAETALAYSLDQQYHFGIREPRSLYAEDNVTGKGEKYFLGGADGTLHTVFAILPNGELYLCNGVLLGADIDNSSLIARLPAVYYSDPSLLFDVPPAVEPPVSLSVDGEALTIDPESGFTGKVVLSVVASDGSAEDMSSFVLDVYNTTPLVDRAPAELPHSIEMSWTADSTNMPFVTSDEDSLDQGHLALSAKVSDLSWEMYELDQTYDFHLDQNGTRYNQLGWRERHLMGTIEGEEVEFVILPSGALLLLGESIGESQVVTTVPQSLHSQLESLVDVAMPGAAHQPPSTVGVSLNNNVLTIDPSSEHSGDFSVLLQATDGNRTSYYELAVQVVNHAPVIEPIPNVSMHWRTDTATLPITAGDEDGEAVRLIPILSLPGGAAVNLPVSLAMNGAVLTIDPESHYLGQFTGYVIATTEPEGVPSSFGPYSSYRGFSVSVFNAAPTIAPIGAKQAPHKKAYNVNLSLSDADVADRPYLSARAWLGSYQHRAFQLDQQYHFSASAGGYSLNATGYQEKYFKGLINSQVATFVILPNGEIYHWTGSLVSGQLVGRVSANYYDNPSLLFGVAAPSSLPSLNVSISNGVLIVDPQGSAYTGTAPVTVEVSDGNLYSSESFNVTFVNTAPTLAAIGNVRRHSKEAAFTLALNASDAEGDALTYSATITNSTSASPAQISVQGDQLVITPSANFLGEFTIKVSVTDGTYTDFKYFKVTIYNNTPVIQGVVNQKLGWRESFVTKLTVSDPDNDPLTIAATAASGSESRINVTLSGTTLTVTPKEAFVGSATVKITASDGQLTAQSSFILTYANSAPVLSTIPTQKMTWGEKSRSLRLQATDPDGDLITYSAAVTYNTQAANVSVSGDMLTIDLVSYASSFSVTVYATDGSSKVSRTFQVNVSNTAPTVDPIADQRIGPESPSTQVRVYGSDPDGDSLTYSASYVSDSQIAYELDQVHNFRLRYSGHAFNRTGNNEKYIGGSKNQGGASYEYVIYPDGRFYEWSGRLSTSTYITTLPLVYYENPEKLFNVAVPSVGDPVVQLSYSGNVLTITPNTGYLGRFWVKATVSDGLAEASALFSVLVTDVPEGGGDGDDGGDDGDGDDDDSNNRKVTICHMPGGDPLKGHTISISKNALKAHLDHGDVIGECPGSPNDPGDGGGTCEQKKIIASPNYTLWNSFLRMIDILELTNPSNNDLPVKISFHSITGALAHQVTVVVPAVNQLDVIINDFPGFVADSYGVIKLEFDGPLDGRMMYYRPSSDGLGYDFAFDMPLSDANFGTTAVSFNTFQPSMDPTESNNIVANWLSVVNLDGVTQRYTVDTYDFSGSLILRRKIEVAPFGRADIDGGHDLAGPNVVGVHIVIPEDVTAEYIAQLTRFGGDAPAGFAPSKYKFAFPLSAKLGQSDPIYTTLSNKFGEFNWIEVINILDHSAGAVINFYASDGRILESLDASIPAHAQLHFNATEYLAAGETGYAAIVPKEPFSIIAQSMGYLREPVTNGITSVYGSPARRALPCMQSGSYNLFLNMENWLLVANTTDNTITTAVKLTGPSLMTEKTLTLSPRSSVYLPIHDPSQFGAQPDSYGLIAVVPEDSTLRLFTEVMRVRYRADGTPDFSAPTPVR